MLQFYKIVIHLIYVSIYVFFLSALNDGEYYLKAAKTNDLLSAILIGVNVVLLALAFFSKKKKYYFYQIIPILLEGVLSYIYSDMGGRYYDVENDQYIRWNPTYEGFYILMVMYVVFFILLFVKIKDKGNIWETLK